jgi:metal-responsive CopG/Arc/MetJ family transcriptional regulator
VKIAVSVPDALHARAEEFAARLGLKRSQLYARAVEELLLAHDEDAVTAALDALAGEVSPSRAERSGRAAGRALIDNGDWEW